MIIDGKEYWIQEGTTIDFQDKSKVLTLEDGSRFLFDPKAPLYLTYGLTFGALDFEEAESLRDFLLSKVGQKINVSKQDENLPFWPQNGNIYVEEDPQFESINAFVKDGLAFVTARFRAVYERQPQKDFISVINLPFWSVYGKIAKFSDNASCQISKLYFAEDTRQLFIKRYNSIQYIDSRKPWQFDYQSASFAELPSAAKEGQQALTLDDYQGYTFKSGLWEANETAEAVNPWVNVSLDNLDIGLQSGFLALSSFGDHSLDLGLFIGELQAKSGLITSDLFQFSQDYIAPRAFDLMKRGGFSFALENADNLQSTLAAAPIAGGRVSAFYKDGSSLFKISSGIISELEHSGIKWNLKVEPNLSIDMDAKLSADIVTGKFKQAKCRKTKDFHDDLGRFTIKSVYDDHIEIIDNTGELLYQIVNVQRSYGAKVFFSQDKSHILTNVEEYLDGAYTILKLYSSSIQGFLVGDLCLIYAFALEFENDGEISSCFIKKDEEYLDVSSRFIFTYDNLTNKTKISISDNYSSYQYNSGKLSFISWGMLEESKIDIDPVSVGVKYYAGPNLYKEAFEYPVNFGIDQKTMHSAGWVLGNLLSPSVSVLSGSDSFMNNQTYYPRAINPVSFWAAGNRSKGQYQLGFSRFQNYTRWLCEYRPSATNSSIIEPWTTSGNFSFAKVGVLKRFALDSSFKQASKISGRVDFRAAFGCHFSLHLQGNSLSKVWSNYEGAENSPSISSQAQGYIMKIWAKSSTDALLLGQKQFDYPSTDKLCLTKSARSLPYVYGETAAGSGIHTRLHKGCFLAINNLPAEVIGIDYFGNADSTSKPWDFVFVLDPDLWTGTKKLKDVLLQDVSIGQIWYASGGFWGKVAGIADDGSHLALKFGKVSDLTAVQKTILHSYGLDVDSATKTKDDIGFIRITIIGLDFPPTSDIAFLNPPNGSIGQYGAQIHIDYVERDDPFGLIAANTADFLDHVDQYDYVEITIEPTSINGVDAGLTCAAFSPLWIPSTTDAEPLARSKKDELVRVYYPSSFEFSLDDDLYSDSTGITTSKGMEVGDLLGITEAAINTIIPDFELSGCEDRRLFWARKVWNSGTSIKQILQAACKNGCFSVAWDEEGKTRLISMAVSDFGNTPKAVIDQSAFLRGSFNSAEWSGLDDCFASFVVKYDGVQASASSNAEGFAEIKSSADEITISSAENLLGQKLGISKSYYSSAASEFSFDSELFYRQQGTYEAPSDQAAVKLISKIADALSFRSWVFSVDVPFSLVYSSSGRLRVGDSVIVKSSAISNSLEVPCLITGIQPKPTEGLCKMQLWAAVDPYVWQSLYDRVWDGGIIDDDFDLNNFKFSEILNYPFKSGDATGSFADGGILDLSHDKNQYQFTNNTYADPEDQYKPF